MPVTSIPAPPTTVTDPIELEILEPVTEYSEAWPTLAIVKVADWPVTDSVVVCSNAILPRVNVA